VAISGIRFSSFCLCSSVAMITEWLGDGETRLPKRVSRRHTCKHSPLSVMNCMAGGALRTKNFHQGHRHGEIPCQANSQ
jgi:hypothetical protein